MSQRQQLDSYAAGLAIFSMFFGAGNIIFPLTLGHYALMQTPFAVLGLLLTAVIMPFVGLLTIFLYQGDTKQFFGRLGKGPGLLIAFFIISLLGPLGSTPRCIALAYATCKLSFPFLSSSLFSIGACLVIFFFSYRKSRLLGLLGYALTPVLIILLGFLAIKGFIAAPHPINQMTTQSDLAIFFHGLKEGYNTMDLLAAFFFAPLVLSSLQSYSEDTGVNIQFILKSSGIGACLLSVVYICFSYLAAYYAYEVGDIPSEQLLAAIAIQILGPYAGICMGSIVILACLTTAMALITAFSHFLHKEIFLEKISYQYVLVSSLILTFFVSTFEFSGISQFLGPVLQACYPALIVLTVFNLGHKLYSLYERRKKA